MPRMMDESEFWNIIDDHFTKSEKNFEKHIVELPEYVESQLDDEKLTAFTAHYSDKLRDSDDVILYAAVLLVRGIMWDGFYYLGDDSFGDLCDCMVAHGKTVYYRALNNPDSLADHREILEYDEMYIFSRICSHCEDRNIPDYNEEIGTPVTPSELDYSDLDWTDKSFFEERLPMICKLLAEEDPNFWENQQNA